MATEVKGLKKLRNPGAIRREEWNRPNRKSKKRLGARVNDFERTLASAGDGFHKPNSNKK